MKKATFHLTPREAETGCKKILNLPGQVSPRTVNVPAGIQNMENIFVHRVSFLLENGKASIEPVEITIYINQSRKSFYNLNVILYLLIFVIVPTVIIFISFLVGLRKLGIAEILYNVEPYLMFGSGFVVSLLLWIIPPLRNSSHI